METKAQYIKRLRTEITEVGSEIEKQIVKLDKLSVEINQGYENIETTLADKQELTKAKLRLSLMSVDEVWNFVWDNVWDAVKEFELKATSEIKHNYEKLEPALQAKQSALRVKLQVPKMSGDQVLTSVWTAVWNVIWGLIEEFKRQAAIEVKQVGDELQALLDKQLTLQTELHELLMSGDEFYNVLKGTTNAMVKGTPS